ncbi:MAG: hypothetical protein CVU56_23210 [Deltaproteobacteria bacterium HGW-Deltaproteobacteria-14]|jgi:hypothetical protein|nr:MAG: hypothetical protein CVU56_23210 [Deltaproteobacteria bacterium HGW-Deltaproteobacteria-14]
MRRASLILSLLGLFVLGAPLAASAQSPFPLQYSERPLTINEGTIAVRAALDYFKIADQGPLTFDPLISLIADVSYGITDDFEVNVLALPLVLSPDTDYGNPVLSATYRFYRGPVEVGGYLGIRIPVQDGSDLQLTPGLPVLLGLTGTTKIITGVYLPITFGDDTVVSLSIPIEFSANLGPQFFIFLNSGIALPDMDPDFANVPLGVGLGYSLAAAADRPLADLYAAFQFPLFINAAAADTIVTDVFEFQIGARFFLN